MKIKAKTVTSDKSEIVLNCPDCNKKHTFTKSPSTPQYYMNYDVDDYFWLDDKTGRLRPDFVCANMHCRFSKPLTIVNLQV